MYFEASKGLTVTLPLQQTYIPMNTGRSKAEHPFTTTFENLSNNNQPINNRSSWKAMRNPDMALQSRDYSAGFPSSRVWMWELDHKESWVPKNWCFWTVVLEKTLESLLDCKEIKLVNPKGSQPWTFTWRTGAEAETLILWRPDVKSWLIGKDPDAGKDWGQEENGAAEDEIVGRHHWFNGHASAAAKSLQSCPTLCDPIDGSPPGSPCPWDSPGKNTGVGCHFLLQCVKVKSESEVAQSCPTLSDPMHCSLPGSFIHGICQARVQEWGAIAFPEMSMSLSKL